MAKKKTRRVTNEEAAETPFEDLFTPSGKSFDPDDLEEDSVVDSGASFWKFQDNPEVIGSFIQSVIAKDDAIDGQWQKGDTIGFLMLEARGLEYILPANYAIIQALENAKKGEIYKVTFLGKSKASKGEFSRFRVVRMKVKNKS